MIARVWHGQTMLDSAEPYLAHLRHDTLPGLGGLDGYEGAYVLRRDGDAAAEFIVVTLWASSEAIRTFAGEDEESAVLPDEARRLLAAFDERAQHYTVAIEDRRPAAAD